MIEELLKIISKYFIEPLASIQKSALKGLQELATYLESANAQTFRLYNF